MARLKGMPEMYQWLDQVAEALNVDRSIVSGLDKELLDLIREIAHNHSRPGGPLTVFLIGLLTPLEPTEEVAPAVREKIAAVRELLAK